MAVLIEDDCEGASPWDSTTIDAGCSAVRNAAPPGYSVLMAGNVFQMVQGGGLDTARFNEAIAATSPGYFRVVTALDVEGMANNNQPPFLITRGGGGQLLGLHWRQEAGPIYMIQATMNGNNLHKEVINLQQEYLVEAYFEGVGAGNADWEIKVDSVSVANGTAAAPNQTIDTVRLGLDFIATANDMFADWFKMVDDAWIGPPPVAGGVPIFSDNYRRRRI